MDHLPALATAVAGRYRVEGEIGRGGMATVYRAVDLRHGRPVAIKVLDPELGAVLGASRFLGEIRVTAALQHPNLLPLFDSGEADGLLFYVMPFIAGETLRARLERERQLPVDEAVRISVAILNALDYAHGHDVIHRDLKPENVLLQAGQPIVADFGIALAVSRAGGARVTQTGISLGTPMYMSPEQAAGDRVIDARTDVYSVGAMLYEMLAGEPPHAGPTTQAIMAKLMTDVPRPVGELRPSVPPHVEAAVARALEKLPADRFTTAGEFAQALVTRTTTGANAARRTGPARGAAGGPRWLVPALGATTLATAALAAWGWLRPAPAASVRTTRWTLTLSDSLAPAVGAIPAISPDGGAMAWTSDGVAGRRLVVKTRDMEQPTILGDPIPGVGAASVGFSPDGRHLAYTAAGGLYRVAITGGVPERIADSVLSSGIAWIPGDSIVVTKPAGTKYELHLVPARGGPSRRLLVTDSSFLGGPMAIPGTRRVFYMQCFGTICERALHNHVLDLDDGDDRRVAPNTSRVWLPRPDLLVTLRTDGVLMATRVDPRSLEPRGDAVPVLTDVQRVDAVPMIDLAPDGTLIARRGRGTSAARYTLVLVDRRGAELPLDTTFVFRHVVAGGNAGWAVSPDGRHLAIGLATESGDDVWLKTLPAGPLTRLTFDTLAEVRPRWSRDGRWVSYTAMLQGPSGLARRLADGSGRPQWLRPLMSNGVYEHAMLGDTLAIVRIGGITNSVGGRDISLLRPGDTTARPIIASPRYDERAFQLSPDQRWIAYESDESGATEIYVRPFPNVDDGRWQVSTGGGRAPLWSRDGRELYWVDAARTMVGAAVAPTATAPGLGARRALFRLRDEWYLPDRENYTPFDIMPDGRFVMARRLPDQAAPLGRLVVIEHFLDEVERRLRAR